MNNCETLKLQIIEDELELKSLEEQVDHFRNKITNQKFKLKHLEVYQNYYKQVDEDWGNSARGAILTNLLEVLENNEKQTTFTVDQFKNKIRLPQVLIDELQNCIDYICNLEPPILRKQYVVVTEDDNWWDVDNSDIDFETGQLVHPETGELLNLNDENVLEVYERV